MLEQFNLYNFFWRKKIKERDETTERLRRSITDLELQLNDKTDHAEKAEKVIDTLTKELDKSQGELRTTKERLETGEDNIENLKEKLLEKQQQVCGRVGNSQAH